MKLAELWLTPNTAFAEPNTLPAAWSRAEWIEATAETWKEMTTPVAASVTKAMSEAMTKQLPPELSQAMGGADLSGMLSGAGSMLFGMQLGQAVGALSCEVVSSTDVGLPCPRTTRPLFRPTLPSSARGSSCPHRT